MFTSAMVAAGTMFSLFAASPASTNFTLKSYDFGNGGVTSSSSTYNLNGTVGSQTGANSANGITILKSGEKSTQDANVPPAATLTNPSGTYNKLHIVISTGGNPTDARFAIAISSDGFATTNYIQTDSSVGSSFGIANYQTYAQWGGAAGFNVLGLQPSTTYAVKVSAYRGKFTASAFGPASAGVATLATSVTFSVATTSNSTPPFNVNFVSLAAGSVFSATSDALLSVSTNAEFGGGIYIKDTNNGLLSSSKSFTIPSASADLGVASSGYGAQNTTLSQTSGGPLTSLAPFNGTGNNVGQLSTNLQQILGLTSPISGGTVHIKFLAKSAQATPAASDYTDTNTVIAAMSF